MAVSRAAVVTVNVTLARSAGIVLLLPGDVTTAILAGVKGDEASPHGSGVYAPTRRRHRETGVPRTDRQRQDLRRAEARRGDARGRGAVRRAGSRWCLVRASSRGRWQPPGPPDPGARRPPRGHS